MKIFSKLVLVGTLAILLKNPTDTVLESFLVFRKNLNL